MPRRPCCLGWALMPLVECLRSPPSVPLGANARSFNPTYTTITNYVVMSNIKCVISTFVALDSTQTACTTREAQLRALSAQGSSVNTVNQQGKGPAPRPLRGGRIGEDRRGPLRPRGRR